MGKYIDLSGRKFNMLTIVRRSHLNKENKVVWDCICECGNHKLVIGYHLKAGWVTSCGCAKSKRAKYMFTTHGKSNKCPEYKLWCSIKYRCLNPSYKKYNLYGGRGIKMDLKWQKSFQDFYNYIGDRPSEKHSLDRFPNKNGNYEPNNVRWATQLQQMSNTNKNVYLTYNNKTLIVSEWARYFNVGHEALRFHLKKGRTIEQIAYHYKMRKLLNKPKSKWIYLP